MSLGAAIGLAVAATLVGYFFGSLRGQKGVDDQLRAAKDRQLKALKNLDAQWRAYALKVEEYFRPPPGIDRDSYLFGILPKHERERRRNARPKR